MVISQGILVVLERNWKAETRANFSGNRKMQREMKEGLEAHVSKDPKNPYNVAFRRMGEIYRQYLRQQFDINKAGGGKWPAIKKSTQKWRKAKYGITHKLILYVTKTFHKLTHEKFSREKAHYEKRTKYGITVGVAPAIKHPDFPGTIYQAVAAHAKGWKVKARNRTISIPARKIFVPANETAKDKMHRSMEYAHRKVIAAANRSVKTKRNS